MDTNGFYGDTFSSGFGDFWTAKRSKSITAKKRDLSDERYSQTDKFYNAPADLSAWPQSKFKVRGDK